MTLRPATIALGLTGLAALVVILDAPPLVRVPIVAAGLVLAPGLTVLRFLPTDRRLDAAVMAVTFGVSVLVIVSGLLALVSLWSGSAVLILIGALTVGLALWPSPARSDDLEATVAISVVWFDGRLCCRLIVDRRSGRIVEFVEGRGPEPVPCTSSPRVAPNAGTVHGEWVVGRLALQHRATRHRGRLRIDLERQPWLCVAHDHDYLWLGPDTSDRSLDEAMIRHWVEGDVDGRPVALGFTSQRQPVVVRLGH
ncbi:MAG: hypothetical protein ACFCVK_09060 [Acidimicrobiales bacterium]